MNCAPEVNGWPLHHQWIGPGYCWCVYSTEGGGEFYTPCFG